MHTFLFSLALLLTTFRSAAQEKAVAIRILQDQAEAVPQNGVARLDKKPFTIEVTLMGVEGVYLYADFSDSIYRLPHEQPIPGFEDLSSMAMAEAEFNKDEELLINPEGWSYWYYDPKLDGHRFDKLVRKEQDRIIATKTIRQFTFFPGGKSLRLEKAKKPLYLFFVSVDEEAGRELERYKLKIDWK
jgi:hypothetical protein